MTFVDTNVILDILSRDPRWFTWSLEALEMRAAAGPLLINEVVYAELAARMRSEADLDGAVDELRLRFEHSPRPALFLAGKAFQRYRRTGGNRAGVLPDLFIGAHAQVLGIPVLTRDVRRYAGYFPKVALITP
jgi:predicted nucleic acid-binding protein